MHPRFVNRIDMFPTPVWCFEFPDFKERKDSLVSYLNRDEIYFTKAERNGLQISDGNLNDKRLHENLSDVTDFFQTIFEEVMQKCGYEKDSLITSMWSTRQRSNGFHHDHIHTNTFLAGVLFVHDENGRASGTMFKNGNAGRHIIQPRVDYEKPQFFTNEEQMPFIPGTALVFPAWAIHTTPVCDSNSRIVIAANSMPIGRTNSDHFDQYTYTSKYEYLPLKEHMEAGYKQASK